MRPTHSRIWRTNLAPYRDQRMEEDWFGQSGEDRLGQNGIFYLPKDGIQFWCICTLNDANVPWEHVSTHIEKVDRTPTWEEMCWLKNLFWAEDEAVIQVHPPAKKHVNCHPFTLHLWKSIRPLELPPWYAV
jgi:hypothetical protein